MSLDERIESESSLDTGREPPIAFRSKLRHLGPGLIIAGSIVGSGELIATTRVGAETGFVLLWLIVLGCLLKVFTQIEIGRMTILRRMTTLEALNRIPGPRLRVNWVVWAWAFMVILTLAQQGGIIGGVGQALAIAMTLTEKGERIAELQEAQLADQVEAAVSGSTIPSEESASLAAELAQLGDSPDPVLWALLISLPTALLLAFGRYRHIQSISTLLVASFTVVTLGTLALLQLDPDWRVTSTELSSGLIFQLPESGWAVALAAFGIIGVGAAELIMYPYWCLERGYAKWVGHDDGSSRFRQRAQGWIRVMKLDAWVSMVIYTVATVAFFLLGAAILGRCDLVPERGSMIQTLSQMYVPVFGSWAQPVFLIGAFFILYSTFFVASASNARVCSDALVQFKLIADDEPTREKWVKRLSFLFPLLCWLAFFGVQAPAQLVIAGGVAQAIMLPILGFAALYYRYRDTPQDLRPSRLWDGCLWLSFLSFCLVSGWLIWNA